MSYQSIVNPNEQSVVVRHKDGTLVKWFIEIPSEKRVRIDVFDDLDNYTIHEIAGRTKTGDAIFDPRKEAEGWYATYS